MSRFSASDIGVDSQHSPELADTLMEMKVPFAFVTGHSRPFEARHSHIPLLHKPFTLGQLRGVLNALMGPPLTPYRRGGSR
jgi:hypothetical protein